MGEAGNGYFIDLDAALEGEKLPQAWQGAWERGYVNLHQALRLTILMGREDSANFNAAANKFLIRFLREVKPSLELTGEVIAALKALPDFAVYPRGEGPECELKELADAIERAYGEQKLPRLGKLRI